MSSEKKLRTNAELANRFQSILARKHLTLYQVSQSSEALHGRSSPYFLPHNLYYELRLAGFSPSLYQFAALSQISGYRLPDWLRVFGFYLEDIPRLQVLLPSDQTTRFDTSLEDPAAWTPWFRDRTGRTPDSPIAPIAELLVPAHPRRLHSLSKMCGQGFIYMKIGRRDALAFPDLFPGSIVRVNPRIPDTFLRSTNGEASKHCFLLEHSDGLRCCRVQFLGGHRIMPVSTLLPYAEIELRLPGEARLLGVADLEIRPLIGAVEPEIPKEWLKSRSPFPSETGLNLSNLLRIGRTRRSMSFRQASALSRNIADLLDDEHYFISASSLSDYEAAGFPPRHLHKVITLCLLYALPFHSFLRAAGIRETGHDPIPDQLIPRAVPAEATESKDEEHNRGGFLGDLLDEMQDVPFFLRKSLGALSGLTSPSLQDVFWIGGERRSMHPYLKGGILVFVNRRRKAPLHFRSKPLWEQPVYLVLNRDGKYLYGCCRVENRTLIVYPFSRDRNRQERFLYRQDAEIVGQIVTIVRKLA